MFSLIIFTNSIFIYFQKMESKQVQAEELRKKQMDEVKEKVEIFYI